MKTSIRKNAYAVSCESYALAERIHVSGKHGRDKSNTTFQNKQDLH